MTSLPKIARSVTCIAAICGAAILWPVYKQKAIERKLAEAARVRAEQGDAQAQYSLGVSYAHGQGVTQDHAEAVRWYRKAADRGEVEAQFYLGFSYFHGQGAPRDYVEAVRWYRKAAGQGDRRAQIVLGNMYRKGQGVPRNYAEAVRWYGKVATSCVHWTSLGVILSGLAVVVVPRRRWGRATWLPWALFSVACAARLAHQLLLPEFSLAVLIGGQPGAMFWGYGRTVWVALVAGSSAMCAFCAIAEVTRGSKGGGDQGQPPTAPEGTLESPA